MSTLSFLPWEILRRFFFIFSWIETTFFSKSETFIDPPRPNFFPKSLPKIDTKIKNYPKISLNRKELILLIFFTFSHFFCSISDSQCKFIFLLIQFRFYNHNCNINMTERKLSLKESIQLPPILLLESIKKRF